MATPLENDASRAERSLYDAFMRGDWTGFAALLADNFFIDDRRKLIGGVSGGRNAFLQTWKTISEQGYDTVEVVDIATRGTNLALQHFVARGTHEFTAEALAVAETDSRRIAFVAVFDAEDLDAAFAELDKRWIEGEEASEAGRLIIAAFDAYNARDWARVKALLTDDFYYLDHRPVGFGSVRGSDEYIRLSREGADLTPNRRSRIVTIQRHGSAALLLIQTTGTSEEGAALEWEDIRVVASRGDEVALGEVFSSDRLEDARARAEEVGVT